MEVLLLGTGGPSGWPEPGCGCASCATAAAAGTHRRPASALVDGVVLLDPQEPPAPGVTLVLLSGTQPHPAGWLDGAADLEVVGPPAALDPYRQRGVRTVAASPGHRHTTAAGHDARAVRHGDGLAWQITGPDRTRLLYAPGEGQLDLTPQDGLRYDLVLSGLGAGMSGLPGLLAQLRRQGLVALTTDVRAVGHHHRAPLPDVLQHHLTAWGVRDVQDADRVTVGQRSARRVPTAGRTLVLGGVRSGKSALAEQLVAAHPDVTYVATGGSRADDAEWQQRVDAHRVRRPAEWRTVETTDLVGCIRAATGALLVDCLGTWLTASLDRHGVWDGAPVTPVEAEVQELLTAWRECTQPLVAVSNEVGSGVVPATSSGRLFRDLLGRLNAQVAAESETVLLTVAGVPVALRRPPGA